MAIITPADWESQFRKQPENLAAATKVVCTHPFHGTEIFWLTADQFQNNLRPLLTPYWVNEYTIILQPCS